MGDPAMATMSFTRGRGRRAVLAAVVFLGMCALATCDTESSSESVTDLGQDELQSGWGRRRSSFSMSGWIRRRSTKAPTKEPTNKPTNEPTNKPTNEPTNKPTKTPTEAPITSPTPPPTLPACALAGTCVEQPTCPSTDLNCGGVWDRVQKRYVAKPAWAFVNPDKDKLSLTEKCGDEKYVDPKNGTCTGPESERRESHESRCRLQANAFVTFNRLYFHMYQYGEYLLYRDPLIDVEVRLAQVMKYEFMPTSNAVSIRSGKDICRYMLNGVTCSTSFANDEAYENSGLMHPLSSGGQFANKTLLTSLYKHGPAKCGKRVTRSGRFGGIYSVWHTDWDGQSRRAWTVYAGCVSKPKCDTDCTRSMLEGKCALKVELQPWYGSSRKDDSRKDAQRSCYISLDHKQTRDWRHGIKRSMGSGCKHRAGYFTTELYSRAYPDPDRIPMYGFCGTQNGKNSDKNIKKGKNSDKRSLGFTTPFEGRRMGPTRSK